MRPLRKTLSRLRPMFIKGGRFQRFGAVYEAFDTFLYSPADVTRGAPHVRDQIDLKRVMMTVYFAALPCLIVAMYITGYGANQALSAAALTTAPGWRGELLVLMGFGFDPASWIDCMAHGALYALPIYIVTFVVGIAWEILFAVVRNHEVNEGFFVTSLLFTLTLPATIPLWQVALGISFGVVLAKEVFGGVGKNFLNPALAGRAFLFFAYPAQISGQVWIPMPDIDAVSAATPLVLWLGGGGQALSNAGIGWWDAFLGFIPGSLGETSTLACLFGAAVLLYTRIASWRIMGGVLLGMVCVAFFFNQFGDVANPMTSMPWYWHLVLGGFIFGMVFMATDPVTACMTDTGKWIFGILIGALASTIRVLNPAYPEGMMLAILFANVVAPLIDWIVMQFAIRRRRKRYE